MNETTKPEVVDVHTLSTLTTPAPATIVHPSLIIIERIEADLAKAKRVPEDFMAWLKAELAKAKAHL